MVKVLPYHLSSHIFGGLVGAAGVHLIAGVLSACGLTPVGNRLSRLILPLPVPVDRVSGA